MRERVPSIGLTIQRLNITLDEQRAAKLARLAERVHVNEGTVHSFISRKTVSFPACLSRQSSTASSTSNKETSPVRRGSSPLNRPFTPPPRERRADGPCL